MCVESVWCDTFCQGTGILSWQLYMHYQTGTNNIPRLSPLLQVIIIATITKTNFTDKSSAYPQAIFIARLSL